MEDGGVVILLEILSQAHIKDEEKLHVLRLLLTVSKAGRGCKEVICENHGMCCRVAPRLFLHHRSIPIGCALVDLSTPSGVKVLAECLAKSSTDETQEAAQMLLESLYDGNTKYQSQLYKGLIALLTCGAPKVQQRVLHTLHTVQVHTHCLYLIKSDIF